MSQLKSKNTVKRKSIIFRIVVGIILLAFIVLMLSDLFIKKTLPVREVKNTRQSENYKFTKHGELSFQSAEGKFISTVDIEIADNDYERAQGLMYRTGMKENQAMLFIFTYEDNQSFYMKNTIMSLDMIFINSSLNIVTIHKNTEPYTLNSSESSAPAQYVLETIAGYTDKFNVRVSDKVIFRKTN